MCRVCLGSSCTPVLLWHVMALAVAAVAAGLGHCHQCHLVLPPPPPPLLLLVQQRRLVGPLLLQL